MTFLFLLYGVAGVVLFCIGLFGVSSRVHLLRKIVALNVMASGIFLFLISVAYRNRIDGLDAVPHAMVLTGIVVALAATAFAIALARRIYATTGSMKLPDDREDQ
jgi:multicomponent Na+:H+ antiporter subunit C